MSNSIDNSYLNQYMTKDYSNLFNSLPKTKDSSNAGLVGLASEFQSIRSGSYGNLLKKYYAKMESEGLEETVQKEMKNRQLVSGNSNSLKNAAKKLSDMDFKKATEQDSLTAIKDFVSAYNSVVDTADDVDNRTILQNAVWMTNMMGKSAGLLGELGISIGDNNQLTLDETKWTAASATTKSALFHGRNGLAEKLMYKANRIMDGAASAVSNTASAYKQDGDYEKLNTDALYEDLF